MAKDVSVTESKPEDKKPKKREKPVIPTKLVIRRLPPYLTEEELIEVLSPLPPHDYFRYVTGSPALTPDNYCRAYINLLSLEEILDFRDRVDGLEFTDSKGNSEQCVLEYAPFQKTPRRLKKKDDTKCATIEEDPEYKAFLESLDAEEEKVSIDLEKYLEELEQREQKNKCVETPLTAYLKQKREERKRIREERRRVEQERRKKRDEERRRREAEKKKKLDAEKLKKKREEKKSVIAKRTGDKDDGKDLEMNEESKATGDDKIKSEAQGKGDANSTTNKGKFEGSERPRSARLSDTKPRKSDAREPIRRGPIGSKPRESYDNEEERDRPKSGYKDRDRPVNNYRDGRGSYERGGYNSRPSRGRGYRPAPSREFTNRKWDRKEPPPPRARGKSWGEDGERKEEKAKPKRPDKEIYRPGSGRQNMQSPRPNDPSGSKPHKYSEQRNKLKQDED